MKEIVAPLPKEQIIAELTPDKLLRKTNKGGNEIYVITHKDSPALMHEIGRLREITFRDAGGGTGKETDIDNYDVSDVPINSLLSGILKQKKFWEVTVTFFVPKLR
jgi:hypothetical protein